MRLAIFSDIHGNWTAFQTMLSDLQVEASATPFDAIWCLGDLGAFGAQPGECIAEIRRMEEQYGEAIFKCIGGNTDRYLTQGSRMASRSAQDEAQFRALTQACIGRDRNLNWNMEQITWDDYAYLDKILHREIHERVEGFGAIIGVHAIPGDDEGNQLSPDSPDEEALDALLDREGRVLVAGHTHRQMHRVVGDWQVVNPGSVGMSFSHPGRAEWAIITIEAGVLDVDLRAVAYDVDKAIEVAGACGYPDVAWLASRLRG